jgi:hypothetical protein
MLAELRSSHFAPLLNQTFLICRDSADAPGCGAAPALRAELIEVETLGSEENGARLPFSLIFRSAEPGALPQRIYRVEHPALGALEIFLVPLGAEPSGSGMRYEAVFT